MVASSKNQQADSWSEYRRLVLAELERLDSAVSKLAQASLQHEKDLMESNNKLNTDLTAKVQLFKEEIVEKMSKAIADAKSSTLKDVIGFVEKSDAVDKALDDHIIVLERKIGNLKTDIQVLKGKAALLGFVSGLTVAVLSVIAQVFWNR